MQKIILILILISSSLWARPKCDELRKDLFALEYKINMSQLKECSSENNRYCKSSGDNPVDKMYYAEVEHKYNQALANLIIAQGLVAIGQTNIGSYNALGSLDEAEVTKAEDYINILELNLNKAQVLTAAMTPVKKKSRNGVDPDENISFLYKYRDRIKRDMNFNKFYNEIENLCIDNSKEVLCTKLKKQKQESTDQNYEQIVEALYGFFNADYKARGSLDYQTLPQDYPEQEYSKFKKYLNIKTKEGEFLNAEEFKNKYFDNGDANRPSIAQLRKSIKQYYSSKLNKKQAAKKVIEQARKLDPISANYIGMEQENDPVQKFFSENLKAPLDSLEVDPTDQLITKIWEDNLDEQIGSFKNQSKLLKKGKRFDDKKCQAGDHICDKADEVAQGLDDTAKILTQAKACYNKETLLKKRECLLDVKNANKSELPFRGTLQDYKDALSDAQANLNFYNNGQPFKNLKTMKGLTLNALHRNNCHQAGKLKRKAVYSCSQDLRLGKSQEYLSLGSNFNDIEIKVLEDWANTQFAATQADENYTQFKATRDEFMQNQCEEQENSSSFVDSEYIRNTCRFFKATAQERADMAQEIRDFKLAEQQEKNRLAMHEKYSIHNEEQTNYIGEIAKTSGAVLLQSLPLLLVSKAEEEQTSSWHKAQMSAINTRVDAYDKYISDLRACQADPQNACQNFQYQMYMNHGADLLRNGYYDQSNFQAGQVNHGYLNPGNPYSFSFSTPGSSSIEFNNDTAFPSNPNPSNQNSGGITEIGFTF